MDQLTNDAVKRIAIDVKDIMKSPLTNENIYYLHDQNDIRYGYAMIIGFRNTPYYCCPLFFRFKFPNDYPYEPPTLTFCTGFDTIRLHPNFYTNGKCCLSILNTWRGEKWSSCQSIRSILITISSVVTEKPLQWEPGYKINGDKSILYEKLIQYTTIRLIRQFINIYADFKEFYFFKEDYFNYIRTQKNNLLDDIKNKDGYINKLLEDLPNNENIKFNIYRNFEIITNWDIVKELIIQNLNDFK